MTEIMKDDPNLPQEIANLTAYARIMAARYGATKIVMHSEAKREIEARTGVKFVEDIKQPTDSYTCANCHSTYKKAWSDEEADKEFEQNFPGSNDEKAIVCDDCYQMMIEARPPVKGINYL